MPNKRRLFRSRFAVSIPARMKQKMIRSNQLGLFGPSISLVFYLALEILNIANAVIVKDNPAKGKNLNIVPFEVFSKKELQNLFANLDKKLN